MTHARSPVRIRRGTARTTAPIPAAAPVPTPDLAARARAAREIAALLRLAELDAARLAGDGGRRGTRHEERADERHRLGAALSADLLEAYDRALRGGRHPAVVSLVASVCSGCHVRLHATLEQKIRRRRGVAPCPHCLRLVYDPAWLVS